MLTRLSVRNFKLFEEVDIELGQRVVLIGPNNSGKTSALQALALWNAGLKRWIEKRGAREVPSNTRGVTLLRHELVSIPVPSARLLWNRLRTRLSANQNLPIEIWVEGEAQEGAWQAGFEFLYANEQSLYCKPALEGNRRLPVPEVVRTVQIAYLPPMSGLTTNEPLLQRGAIAVRLGEGRTAEVLRNLCYQVYESSPDNWRQVCQSIERLFGTQLETPTYIPERGEIQLYYRDRSTRLELVSCGRGQQQTLLLLAHMYANPKSVILLDEPDAHLEILRQRQIYQVLSEVAEQTESQILAASHSEVLLNEAAERDIVIAFLGRPHRIDDRGNQLLKALRDIGFEDYYLAEQKGWVLYLEGSTDLAILQAFANTLQHPAKSHLERPFVKYVGNQPRKAIDHFYGLREAKSDLVGFALFDRLEKGIIPDPNLKMHAWRMREIENYLCTRTTLLSYARYLAEKEFGALFREQWVEEMNLAIEQLVSALRTLNKPDPFGGELKVSEEFLTPLFAKFFQAINLQNRLQKSDFHILAQHVPPEEIDTEVVEVLDAIVEVAQQARPQAG